MIDEDSMINFTDLALPRIVFRHGNVPHGCTAQTRLRSLSCRHTKRCCTCCPARGCQLQAAQSTARQSAPVRSRRRTVWEALPARCYGPLGFMREGQSSRLIEVQTSGLQSCQLVPRIAAHSRWPIQALLKPLNRVLWCRRRYFISAALSACAAESTRALACEPGRAQATCGEVHRAAARPGPNCRAA